MRLFWNIRSIVLDAIAFARNLCRSRSALAAENLFLRKQLTFFVERKQAPLRTDNATRLTMATLARLFDWKEALIVVKPDTLVLWHRKGVVSKKYKRTLRPARRAVAEFTYHYCEERNHQGLGNAFVFLDTTGTRPPIHSPLRLEAATLSRIRSAVTSRSNCAKDSSICSVSRPMLVAVLKD